MKHDQSRLILVLGGAQAGKSTFALRLAKDRIADGRVCFIATLQPLDDEMTERISRHRSERPADWNTIEEPYQLDEALHRAGESNVVIIDCLTLFVSNWLLRSEDDSESQIRRILGNVLSAIKCQSKTVICVSNEVGLGIVPDNHMGRMFRDLLGRVNQRIAAAADEVYFLAAGLPLRLNPKDSFQQHG
jgi:adenosyl cobinamide kinase/adenosyl cobinamide phosphate guanylyltransferase